MSFISLGEVEGGLLPPGSNPRDADCGKNCQKDPIHSSVSSVVEI